VQYGQTTSVDNIIDACQRNKVILKGIIASPLHSEEGILQTLNMRIRYISNFMAALSVFVRDKTDYNKSLAGIGRLQHYTALNRPNIKNENFT